MRKTLANKLTANQVGAELDGKTACIRYRPYGICRLGQLGSILRKTEISRFHHQKYSRADGSRFREPAEDRTEFTLSLRERAHAKHLGRVEAGVGANLNTRFAWLQIGHTDRGSEWHHKVSFDYPANQTP